MGWDIDLFTTTSGRNSSIANLRKLRVDLIYTFEMKLADLIKIAKSDVVLSKDKSKRMNWRSGEIKGYK